MEEINNNQSAPVILKTCSKCKTEQPLENYRKNPSVKDGLKPECILCDNERARIYYEANKKKQIKNVIKNKKRREQLKKEIARLEKETQKQNPAKSGQENNPDIKENKIIA